ncbi:hypothetical protein [Actinospica robiniae]|uniref:hypothetical protein n=1 Tax=Actinospica robiniae TaxID=304901 RepID=UPI0004070FB7|nr:hypothetical protein [Actinospica robiniae]
MKLTMRRAAMATAGVVAAGGLVLGGTEAFASSPGFVNTSNAAAANPTASASAKAGCKPAAKAKHPRACAGRRAVARRDARALLRGRGVHGQETVKAADGSFAVQEWQTGKVASINGDAVTVTDASGTTWTWTVQSSTRYRISGNQKGSLSGVHAGDTVLLTGVQNGSANDVKALTEVTGTAKTTAKANS